MITKIKATLAVSAFAALAMVAFFSGPVSAEFLPAEFTAPDGLLWVGLGGMIINQQNLSRLFTGYQTAFNAGRTMAEAMHQRVSTMVSSTTAEELYAWLGKMPRFKEWVGDRVIESMKVHDYRIRNVPYENTISVDRDNIEDDTFGVFAPLFQEMGMATEAHPSELVYDLLPQGFTELGYDGQPFFDTDHPVLDANGQPQSVPNTDGGAGTPWYLIDDSRALKPIIFQTRRNYDFQSMDRATDTNVFMRKEFIYGVDARVNAGFALWQLAWGSKQALNSANYKIAREGMMSITSDYGRPMAIRPRLLVVPPSLEGEGLEIINAERDAGGATNVYKGTAELLVVPWLV